jgi:hypothetical protein
LQNRGMPSSRTMRPQPGLFIPRLLRPPSSACLLRCAAPARSSRRTRLRSGLAGLRALHPGRSRRSRDGVV